MTEFQNKVSIIPAAPGWFQAEPIGENDKVVDIHLEPIIAWVITCEYQAQNGDVNDVGAFIYPVTVGGYDPSFKYLRRPDGSFCIPYLEEDLTREQVLTDMQEKGERV